MRIFVAKSEAIFWESPTRKLVTTFPFRVPPSQGLYIYIEGVLKLIYRVMSGFCATPVTPQRGIIHECATCSVCWSPLSRLESRELFGDQSDEDDTDRVVSRGEDGINGGLSSCENDDKESGGRVERKVIKTKCGHSFHEACLMQVKVRKAECPYCRAPLTPILNPGVVASALESESLPSTTRRDAIIHASIRARNAVLRANEQRMRSANAENPVLHAQVVA